jgi:hypothetical protein
MHSVIGSFYIQGKIRRFTQNIKIKEKDLGIKLMNKKPLSMPLLSGGLIIPISVHFPQQLASHFIY